MATGLGEAINVRDLGAVGDGATLGTAALQAAFDRVRDAGAGVVLVPPGTYVTGSLVIHSHTRLELMPGAVLLGSPDLEDYVFNNPYGPEPRKPFVNPAMQDRHLLLLYRAHHVTITGGGVIDGNGEAFWHPQSAPGAWIKHKDWQRPCPLIECIECEDLRLEGFTIQNSPGWTVELLNCDRVFVHGVRVANSFFGPNTDAFDIGGSRDVMISDCHIVCGDDAFCIKTMPHTRSSERITITNCTMRTNCVGLKLGCFESHKDMRQITFQNCVVYESTRAVGLYNFKGATFEDITISNIVCDSDNEMILNRPIHVDLRHETEKGWGGVSPTGHAGLVRNLLISNVIAKSEGRILLTCADGGTMENVTLRDIQLRVPRIDDPEPTGRNAGSAQFSNHSIDARMARAALVAEKVRDLQVHNLTVDWPEDTPDAPPMHVGWLRGCTGLIDAPLARPNREGVEAYNLQDSTVRIRD